MELKDPSCDLDAQNESLSTALHRAAHKNDVDLVNKLIDAGADYNMKDRMGRTPFNLGNDEVKAAIQVRIDAVIAKYEAEEQQRLSSKSFFQPNFLIHFKCTQKIRYLPVMRPVVCQSLSLNLFP